MASDTKNVYLTQIWPAAPAFILDVNSQKGRTFRDFPSCADLETILGLFLE